MNNNFNNNNQNGNVMLDQQSNQGESFPQNNQVGAIPSTQSYKDMLAELTRKNEEQSYNLIEQRNIVNGKFEANKALEDERVLLLKKIETLEAQANTNQNASPTSAFVEQLNAIQSQLNETKLKERERAFMPVIETFNNYGIPQNNIQPLIKEIQKKYGVDLINNPNVELVQFELSQMRQSEPNNLPLESFNNSNNQVSVEQQREEAFQLKLQARLEEIERTHNNKKIK